ncbi:MAG: phosphatase PAP2 family protein [Candidatus Acidiferrales bacterium]
MSVDKGISVFFNSVVLKSRGFDQILVLISLNPLLKGMVLIAAFWSLWFYNTKQPDPALQKDSRTTLLTTLLICAPMLAAVRILATLLPYSVRPVLVPELHLAQATSLDVNNLAKWSSFPSDHAAMFLGLATGLYLVSRRMGIAMYIYTSIFILLPRVILGIHYTSDIVVGALIGILVIQLVRVKQVRSFMTGLPFRILDVAPGAFYAGLFVLTFLTADLYDPARNFVKVLLNVCGFISS